MQKSLFLLLSFFLAFSANAATFHIDKAGVSGIANQTIATNNASEVSAGGDAFGVWSSRFDITPDANTSAVINWSFDPQSSLAGALLTFGNSDGLIQQLTFGDFSLSVMMTAGTTYWVDFSAVVSKKIKYNVGVISEIPVPAAIFLFAPALLGFMALRRRAQVLKIVAA